MVCQLWPLVVSLYLNNPPWIGFTCVKLPIKIIWCREQGACQCKVAGTGFHSFVANRTQMCTADCHEENNLTADCHDNNNRIADCHSQESKFES
jgi:hypothetical protein